MSNEIPYGLMQYIQGLENKELVIEAIKQLVMIKAKIVKVNIEIVLESGTRGNNSLYLEGYENV